MRLRLPHSCANQARNSDEVRRAGFVVSEAIVSEVTKGAAPTDTGWETVEVSLPEGSPTEAREVVMILAALCGPVASC